MLRVSTKAQAERAAVQRDDDMLTAEEIITHKAEIEAAKLAELRTWAKCWCFTRKMRHAGENFIDCRWVLKWRWENDATSATNSATTPQTASRVLRVRLTVRGCPATQLTM